MEAKHLIPYLPYDLKVMCNNQTHKVLCMSSQEIQVNTGQNVEWQYMGSVVKPILKPMFYAEEHFKLLFCKEKHEDVTNYLDYNFLMNFCINITDIENVKPQALPYGTIQVLFKHHFDVFGLINKGLAVSELRKINNINSF